jgi:aerobic carbon-monoxide dehydrogenase medium subunit
VKPAAFEYFDPTSVDEAIALLARFGPDAKPLAGGQSLVPLMNFRLAQPKVLVDLGRVAALSYLRREHQRLLIGAMTTHAEIEESEVLAAVCPLLPAAARLVGHVQIRSRGTIGGSVAHADPAAEWPMVLTALDAQLLLRGPHGQRRVPAREFFVTYLTTVLEPNELITEVELTIPPVGHGWSVREVTRRYGDFALVGVAAVVVPGADGGLASVRLALGGVGGAPVDASNVAASLVGTRPDQRDLEAVARRVVEMVEPDSDVHAPADYRREVAGVLCERALAEALGRARPAAETRQG